MKVREEKGITLVALMALVTVLIIISGVALGEINKSNKDTKSDVFESEIRVVQNAVLQRKTEADLTKIDYDELPGQEIKKSEVQNIAKGINLKGYDGEYKILDPEELQKLGITNTEDTYIVNYNTGEVINKDKFDMFDEKLYIYATE